MKIDERLLAYKPISVTLNFDWENTTYDERVLARHNYIEEQKKKDPNYIGWDFPEYFSSNFGTRNDDKPVFRVDRGKLVNTLGQIVRIHGSHVYLTFGCLLKSGYCVTQLSENDLRTRMKVHRVVASTFIPIPDEYKETRLLLIINHKNDVKNCNLRSNLEWCTNQTNIIKAFETGLMKSRAIKCTVNLPGELYKNIYYFTRLGDLKEYGFSDCKVHRSDKTGKMYKHCFWKFIDNSELDGKVTGMSEWEVSILNDKKYGPTGTYPSVGTIVTEGPCKGEQFVLYGQNQIHTNGFATTGISKSIKTGKIHKSCVWTRPTREEAVNIPIGLTEAQKEHIFGKKE